MLGKILGNGVLCAEDGSRYNFDIAEIENLGELSESDLGGISRF